MRLSDLKCAMQTVRWQVSGAYLCMRVVWRQLSKEWRGEKVRPGGEW